MVLLAGCRHARVTLFYSVVRMMLSTGFRKTPHICCLLCMGMLVWDNMNAGIVRLDVAMAEVSLFFGVKICLFGIHISCCNRPGLAFFFPVFDGIFDGTVHISTPVLWFSLL